MSAQAYDLLLSHLVGVQPARSPSRAIAVAHAAFCPQCQPDPGPDDSRLLLISVTWRGIIQTRCRGGCTDEAWEPRVAIKNEMLAAVHIFEHAKSDEQTIAAARRIRAAADRLVACMCAAARSDDAGGDV